MKRLTTQSTAATLSLMALVLGTLTPAATAQRGAGAMEDDDCLAGWSAPFGGDGGVNDRVWTIVEFDDGSGPALYAGGEFTNAGGVTVNSIARWDGEKWESLGGGITAQSILSLAAFDDGSGPALYVAGGLNITDIPGTTGIARWDGNEWSSVGGGMDGGVTQLHVADDGTGPALYAGGNFTAAGGVEANRIARWDGTQWSALGEGVSGGNVNAIATFDDGSGPAVYVAGFFTEAGGKPVNFIAKWDGKNWFDVGGGTNDTIYALTAFNDSSGDALYAGGSFTDAGGVNAQRVARWDGEEWSNVGLGVSGGSVFALTTHSDGETTMLYAGGSFTTAEGVEVNRMARWNGTAWSGLDNGLSGIVRAVHSSQTSTELYVGGDFVYALHHQDDLHHMRGPYILRWSNERWLRVGQAPSPSAGMTALATFDSGYGEELYSAVPTEWVGGGTAPWVGRWDGETWVPLTGGAHVYGGVGNMRVLTFDSDSMPSLYVTGALTADGTFVGVARWDGSAWYTLGSGLKGQCSAVEVFDDGTGESLYVGGNFAVSGDGAEVKRIARWNGDTWHPLGEGVGHLQSNRVAALQTFDDGTGPALYVGGHFTQAGGKPALRVARWDGAEWSPVGDGFSSTVTSLTVFNDGSEPALYAAGHFTASGNGEPLNYIARWNGESWSPVGGGVNAPVRALHVVEDCSVPALYVGGRFTMAGDVDASFIARWDGTEWSALGCGLSNHDEELSPFWDGVAAMTTFHDAQSPALYVGGNFRTAGGQPAGHIARWEGERRVGDLDFDCVVDGSDLLLLLSAWGECPDGAPCPADLSGDGVVDGQDLLILLANWG